MTIQQFKVLYQEMRAMQKAYFEQKKLDATRYPSKEARALLKRSKELERQLDQLVEDIQPLQF